jgi:hypothetical protein
LIGKRRGATKMRAASQAPFWLIVREKQLRFSMQVQHGEFRDLCKAFVGKWVKQGHRSNDPPFLE